MAMTRKRTERPLELQIGHPQGPPPPLRGRIEVGGASLSTLTPALSRGREREIY